MQPFNLGYDNFLGRLAIGRIHEGTIKSGQTYVLKKNDSTIENSRVTKLYTFKGTSREETGEAYAGDIVMIAGFGKIDIGETICENQNQESLPAIMIDEPTIFAIYGERFSICRTRRKICDQQTARGKTWNEESLIELLFDEYHHFREHVQSVLRRELRNQDFAAASDY